MPLFPVLDLESLVQENDKTRLDGSKSYASGTTPITKLEIQPSTDEVFYDVTETNGCLDWQFAYPTDEGTPAAGVDFLVTLRVTTGEGEATETKEVTKPIKVITATTDMLFSTDDRLRKHETDIMRFVPEGRATFKDVHRRAQGLIMAWLDTEGYIDNYFDKLTIARLKDLEEVSEWATMMTLRLIFEGISNAPDDVYRLKARKYEGLEAFYRGRANLKVDVNKDGQLDVINERLDIRTARAVRR